MKYNFDEIINRKNTYSTQWDYIGDRFSRSDILPFSISDTDFAVPPSIIDDLKGVLDHRIFGYTRWNHDDYKQAIQHYYKMRMKTHIDQDIVVYSPSVIYSVSLLLRILSKPGDGVLVFNPMYDAFIDVIQENDRVLFSCTLSSKNNYEINFELFEQQISKSSIFLLCSPHNPTGKVFTKKELDYMIEICKRHDVWMISDEIHSDVILFNHTFTSAITCRDTYDKIIVVSSSSKTFNTPSLGGSYALIPDDEVRSKFMFHTKHKDFVNSANIMGMYAVMSAYTKSLDYIDELVSYIESNMNLVKEFIENEIPSLQFCVPQATYLAWIDARALHCSDECIQEALVNVGKVGIMSGSVYGSEGQGYLRMNVGCPRSKVIKGLNGLRDAVNHLLEVDFDVE